MDSNNNLFNGIQDAVDNNDGEQTDGELVLDMLAASPDGHATPKPRKTFR